MYEAQDNTELFFTESRSFSDADIPEPVEHWMLEDFADLVPSLIG